MTAAERIAALRQQHPGAERLAHSCALAFRIEPALLRALRLALPGTDASAEADLWHSGLLTGRDLTAIVLDPLVATQLRANLRVPRLRAQFETAAGVIAAAHRDAHWSVRLEERIRYLDCLDPAQVGDQAAELLLAAVEHLRSEPQPAGIARWLLGAVGRLPASVRTGQLARVSAAAAGLHVDGRAPASALSPAETASWLPWLAGSLPTVRVPVGLRDGAVVISGPSSPDSALIDVPQTSPLVLDASWSGGSQPMRHRVEFGPGEAVQLETGSPSITLTTVAGLSYELRSPSAGAAAPRTGLNFDAVKARLRPCLERRAEIEHLVSTITADPQDGSPAWTGVVGRSGEGASTLLLAVADALQRTAGFAVIEHYFGVTGAGPAPVPGEPHSQDQPGVMFSSLRAQLDDAYRAEGARHQDLPGPDAPGPDAPGDRVPFDNRLKALAGSGAFQKRPLLIVLDGVQPATRSTGIDVRSVLAGLGLASHPPDGVQYLVSCHTWTDVSFWLQPGDTRLALELGRPGDVQVCAAMIEVARPVVERALGRPLSSELVMELQQMAGSLPGPLDRILRWIGRQPPGSTALPFVPAILAANWPAVSQDRFSGIIQHDFWDDVWSLLRAADGLNTLDDVREAVSEDQAARWPDLWAQLRALNLVLPPGPDGVIRLSAPEAADLMCDPADRRRAHLDLAGSVVDPAGFEPAARISAAPPGFDAAQLARTWRPSQLSAAVRHLLAAADLGAPPAPSLLRAVALVTDPLIVRRRYGQDLDQLLADLDLVAAAVPTARGGGTPTTVAVAAAARVNDLRAAIHHTVKRQVPVTRLIQAVIDRLAERGTRLAGWDESWAAPLRVTARRSADTLHQDEGYPQVSGPVLAIAVTAAEDVVVVRPSGVESFDGSGVRMFWSDQLIGAVRAPDAPVLCLWSATEVFTLDLGSDADLIPVAPPVGSPAVSELIRVTDEGSVLVVPAAARGVTVWTRAALRPTRSPRLPLVGHGGPVTAVLDLDEQLITASADGTIRLWDATSGQTIQVLTGHRGAVTALAAIGPDSFVSAGADGCVLFWQRQARQVRPTRQVRLIGRWQAHDSPITSLVTAPGEMGEPIVLAGSDQGRVAWRFGDRRTSSASMHHEPIRGLALRGRVLASWADGVTFWDLGADRQVPYSGHNVPGGARDVLLGEQTFTVLCGDGSVQQRPIPVLPPEDGSTDQLGCLAVVDGLVLTSGDSSQAIQVVAAAGRSAAWDVVRFSTGRPVQVVSVPGQLLVRLTDGTVAQLDLASGAITGEPLRNIDRIASDRQVVWAARGREVGLLDGQELHRVGLVTAEVTSLAGGPVSLSAVAGCADGSIRRFTAQVSPETAAVQVLSTSGSAVTAVAWSGAREVISGTADGEVHWRSLDRAAAAPRGHAWMGGAVTGIVTHRDWAVVASLDGTLALWDRDRAAVVHQVELGAPVVALALGAVPVSDGGPAGSGLVAARTAVGALFLLTLDPGVPPSRGPGVVLADPVYPPADRASGVALRLADRARPVDVLAVSQPDLDPSSHPVHRAAGGGFDVPIHLGPDDELTWLTPVDQAPVTSVECMIQGPGVPGYRQSVRIENGAVP